MKTNLMRELRLLLCLKLLRLVLWLAPRETPEGLRITELIYLWTRQGSR